MFRWITTSEERYGTEGREGDEDGVLLLLFLFLLFPGFPVVGGGRGIGGDIRERVVDEEEDEVFLLLQ